MQTKSGMKIWVDVSSKIQQNIMNAKKEYL